MLSVVVGVGLALLFVSVVGLTWWSLGAIVSVSIIMGQLLRLGPQLIEVPISAMLVLAVGYSAGAENAAVDRTLETLVGSAVGVLVNILFPPAVKVRSAASAVQRLAEEIAGCSTRSAEEIEDPHRPSSSPVAGWRTPGGSTVTCPGRRGAGARGGEPSAQRAGGAGHAGRAPRPCATGSTSWNTAQ